VADIYVYNLGDNSTGAAWATAKTTVLAGLTAAGVGGTVYVANDHTETTAAAIPMVAPGTMASPNRILCVNRAGTVPPVSADLVSTPSATVATTGANNITLTGIVSVCHGIIFNTGDGTGIATFLCSNAWNLNKCSVRLLATGSGTIRGQGAGFRSIWTDTTMQFANIVQGVTVVGSGEFIWRGSGSTILGATIPTALFPVGSGGFALLEGVDLNPMNGKALMNLQMSARSVVMVKDCKLPAGFASGSPVTGTAAIGTGELIISHSANGTSNVTQERYDAFGSMIAETSIVRTGGATDGTTPVSWKFVTLTSCKPDQPMTSLPIMIWNDTAGAAKTVTIYGVGTTVPTNAEVWVEVEYHGSSATPIGSFVSGGKADPLAAAGAGSSDASAWGGSPPASKFKLVSPSFTPQMKGYFTIWVKFGTNGTFYIDPKPVVA
jgi:hypothetical protein